MSIQGKTIVIIGGSSGIGLATAKAAAARGGNVIIVGRDRDRLQAAAKEVTGEVRTAAVDGSNAKAMSGFFAELGSFDHLVVAAGGDAAWGPFLELDPDRLRAGFEGKFWVHFHAARYGAPLLAKDGSITFMIGGAARAAIPGTAGLAAVNGAIVTMARTLAKELAPKRVNVVSPGFVDTPAYDHLPQAERSALYGNMAQNSKVGRIGHVDDIASSVLFLIENGFTTGAVLDVDGGVSVG